MHEYSQNFDFFFMFGKKMTSLLIYMLNIFVEKKIRDVQQSARLEV